MRGIGLLRSGQAPLFALVLCLSGIFLGSALFGHNVLRRKGLEKREQLQMLHNSVATLNQKISFLRAHHREFKALRRADGASQRRTLDTLCRHLKVLGTSCHLGQLTLHIEPAQGVSGTRLCLDFESSTEREALCFLEKLWVATRLDLLPQHVSLVAREPRAGEPQNGLGVRGRYRALWVPFFRRP